MGVRAVGMDPNSVSDLQKMAAGKWNSGAFSPMDTFFFYISQCNTSLNTLLHLIASPTGGKNK